MKKSEVEMKAYDLACEIYDSSSFGKGDKRIMQAVMELDSHVCDVDWTKSLFVN